ncbi:MAG: hypothetical protein QOI42_1956, partial [Frankiaceae bacterium]|nr:hypothetical protein [Frankiaceae bacterium]
MVPVAEAPVVWALSAADAQSWLVGLSRELDVAVAAPVVVRARWHDTPDRRLVRRGLALRETTGRGPRVLVLTDLAGTPLETAPHVRVPRFAAELGPGPLADRVTAAAGVRALQPVAVGTSRRTLISVRDARGKTVCRLVLDDVVTEHAAAARVTVAALRGYDDEAQRVRERLAGDAFLRAQEQPVLAAVLPAPQPRAALALDPADSAESAIRAVLQHDLERMRRTVDGAADATDTEFLREFRVGVRRTRAVLALAR